MTVATAELCRTPMVRLWKDVSAVVVIVKAVQRRINVVALKSWS